MTVGIAGMRPHVVGGACCGRATAREPAGDRRHAGPTYEVSKGGMMLVDAWLFCTVKHSEGGAQEHRAGLNDLLIDAVAA